MNAELSLIKAQKMCYTLIITERAEKREARMCSKISGKEKSVNQFFNSLRF